MAELWSTEDLPGLLWDDEPPDDHTPTRFDLRQAEIRDLKNQGPGPKALWTAHTINAPEYL